MRVGFYTLGCKVNQYETEVLKSKFLQEGFDIVSDQDNADVYVINSCTVTAVGDKKTRQILNRMKKQNPNAIIALTGCMPQAFPDKASLLTKAQVITGSNNKQSVVEDVKKALVTGERIIDIEPYKKSQSFEKMRASNFEQKTRAFVKIQDGCNKWCTYCIIPKARGPIRSKPLDELKLEIEQLVQNGYQEIVLVGINLSSYGKECGLRLIDAVELVCSIDGVTRVRLGSLEPELLLDDDIERLSKLTKFCPQFHLSLQSGCDETLKRMKRHYDTKMYYELCQKLRNKFKDCAITTDIMVGFPGETQEEFEKSLQFAKKVEFAKAHVFAYSAREGTKAAEFEGQVDKKIKEDRSKKMIEVTKNTRIEFLKQHIGKVYDVLFEATITEEGTEGYTKNYIPVFVKSTEQLTKKIRTVKITDVNGEHCIGKLI